MVASAQIGVAWARWILAIEPLASATADQVAEWMGPTLDLYGSGSDFTDDPPLRRTHIAAQTGPEDDPPRLTTNPRA